RAQALQGGGGERAHCAEGRAAQQSAEHGDLDALGVREADRDVERGRRDRQRLAPPLEFLGEGERRAALGEKDCPLPPDHLPPPALRLLALALRRGRRSRASPGGLSGCPALAPPRPRCSAPWPSSARRSRRSVGRLAPVTACISASEALDWRASRSSRCAARSS